MPELDPRVVRQQFDQVIEDLREVNEALFYKDLREHLQTLNSNDARLFETAKQTRDSVTQLRESLVGSLTSLTSHVEEMRQGHQDEVSRISIQIQSLDQRIETVAEHARVTVIDGKNSTERAISEGRDTILRGLSEQLVDVEHHLRTQHEHSEVELLRRLDALETWAERVQRIGKEFVVAAMAGILIIVILEVTGLHV